MIPQPCTGQALRPRTLACLKGTIDRSIVLLETSVADCFRWFEGRNALQRLGHITALLHLVSKDAKSFS